MNEEFQPKAFLAVIGPDGTLHTPENRNPELWDYRALASRLAKENPGSLYFVAQVYGSAVVRPGLDLREYQP